MIHFVGGYVSRYHFHKRKMGNRRPHFNGCIIDSVFPLVRIHRTVNRGETEVLQSSVTYSRSLFGLESGKTPANRT